MNRGTGRIGVALGVVCLFCVAVAGAQVSISTLSEAQLGNIPGDKPADLRTAYVQLNLDLTYGALQAGVRNESHRTSEIGRNYNELVQRFVRYHRGPIEFSVGSYYSIIGQGLLLHAFEQPGVITEERSARRRYQLARDLDGAQLRYHNRIVDLVLLRGSPLNSDFPPGLSGIDRRQGTVRGGRIELKPTPFLDLGTGLLEIESGGKEQNAGTLFARIRLGRFLERLGLRDSYTEIYGEYAQYDMDLARWFSLDRDLPRALYSSFTLGRGGFGMSFEYKDYRRFAFATLNNPPPLIREHESYLLNRDTHELLADDESGTQLEISYGFLGGQTLTTNFTTYKRRGDAGPGDDMSSWELFTQADLPLAAEVDGQLFADYSRDRSFNNERRRTVGSGIEWQATSRYAGRGDLQFQDVDRRFGREKLPYRNLYLTLGVDRAPAWSWSIVLQRSTDELARGSDISGTTYWWGANMNWEIRNGRNLNLFAGRRRPGLACTGGTCYEVLGFEGVELRMVSRVF